MHAAHARNSGQEFLELELYYDFSRCNPNSHEICMSQIARYTDDRINGRSFSSSISRFDAKARDPAGERDRLVTTPRFTPRSPFHRLDSVPCNEFPDRIRYYRLSFLYFLLLLYISCRLCLRRALLSGFFTFSASERFATFDDLRTR